MKLIKFTTDDHPIYINPLHVVAVRKGMKDTNIQTLIVNYTVKESAEVAVRLLGAEEIPLDITPALTKSIDL